MKEKLIKSKARVRERGEVFTPSWLVKDMCDLIPQSEWTIESRFLEPSCGNGNFLVEILDRKLKLCDNAKSGLQALSSIYGIDIMQDNVDEARKRMLNIYMERFPEASELALLMATGILINNIRCGNSLEIMKQWEEQQ